MLIVGTQDSQVKNNVQKGLPVGLKAYQQALGHSIIEVIKVDSP